MSHDPPAPHQDGRSESVATVQWGTQEPSRRRHVGRLMERFLADPRLPLVIAGLGALATFIAMTDDWIVIRLPDGPGGELMPLPSNVAGIGNLGASYLLGTLIVVGCLALALFGSAGVRHNARVVGLALAAATGGVLLAVTVTMDDSPRTVYAGPDQEIDVTSGRGLAMAYVATIAFGTALLLAALRTRPVAAVVTTTGDATTGDATAADTAAGDTTAGASPRAEASPAGGLPPPADLTVTPVAPFARPEPPFTRPAPSTRSARPNRRAPDDRP